MDYSEDDESITSLEQDDVMQRNTKFQHHTADSSSISSSSDSMHEDDNDDDDDNDNAFDQVIDRAIAGTSSTRILPPAHRESEFVNIPNHTGSSGLTVSDLLSNVTDSASRGTLKKRLSRLDKVKAVLPKASKVVSDRAERKIGYAQASEYVTRWQDTVKSNREAPSVSFPLKDPSTVPTRITIRTLASGIIDEPETQLEKEIADVLKATGMAHDADVTAREDHDLAEIPDIDEEEIARRRALLQKSRALMFYEEQKAKRVKRIKSKTFRKLKRKRDARLTDAELTGLEQTDPEAVADVEEREAFVRAQERMAMRHRNTSKNMRELLRRGEGKDMEEKRQEALRKRIRGEEDEEQQDEGEEEDDDDSETAAVTAPKGVFAMAFMRRGEEKALSGNVFDKDVDPVHISRRSFAKVDEEVTSSSVIPVKRTATVHVSSSPSSSDDESSKEEEMDDHVIATTHGTENGNNPPPHSTVTEDNPWLVVDPPSSRRKSTTTSTQQPNETIVRVADILDNLPSSSQIHNTENEELVRMAFADVLDKEFEEEKKVAEQGDDEDGKAASIKPGWGSWAGPGVRVAAPRRPPIPAPRPTRNGDHDVPKHVIVSERTNKAHVQKFAIGNIPYPFETREQYLKSLAHPVGSEWNTNMQFERQIKPDTIVKLGAFITPISAKTTSSSSKAKEKATPTTASRLRDKQRRRMDKL